MSQTLLRSKAGKGQVAMAPGIHVQDCRKVAWTVPLSPAPSASQAKSEPAGCQASLHGLSLDVIQTWSLPLGAASLVGWKQGSERTHSVTKVALTKCQQNPRGSKNIKVYFVLLSSLS